jgi:disulfide bond formation protein DsbB
MHKENLRTVKKVERIANTLTILFLLGVLYCASGLQFLYNELPCPLCILQRLGFFCIIFTLLLNLKFDFRPSHYAMALLSALFTAFVALRQIALHIIPGTGAYGKALLSFHLYTWSFIIAMGILILTALLLSLDKQYIQDSIPKRWRRITKILFFLTFLILLINIVSLFMMCGFNLCPDNPVLYKLTF